MFVAAIKRVEKAVFPIFRELQFGQEMEISVVGAGFFIDNKGTFASCAHLFKCDHPKPRFMFGGYLPSNSIAMPLDIAEVARDDVADIYIGKIATKPFGFLPILRTEPDIGRSVCIVGYPLAELSQGNGANVVDATKVRRYVQPSFVLDRGRYSTGERRYDGFLVRDVGLYGMSGGPVVDTAGWVVGMQAAVAHRVSSNGTHQINVDNAIAIHGHVIQTFYNDQQGKRPDAARTNGAAAGGKR